jgi:predicted PolB exonuclease-like 3'-5' exonuclease
MSNYLILDIETVPDESLIDKPAVLSPEKELSTTLLGMPESTRAQAVPEPSSVPPPYANRPIAIGCLYLDGNLAPIKCGCLGVSKYGDDERALLVDFANFGGREKPIIITWNGRGFDLPVITLRCYKYGIPLEWYDQEYRYRYSDKKNIDLFDLMTDFGAVSKKGFRLDKIAKLIGLPGKYGVDGSQVKGLFEEGRFVEIEEYCVTDMLQTAFIFIRFQLWRGRISLEMHDQAVARLLEFLKEKHEKFISLIDQKTLFVLSK